jgi:hypothetical protein
MASNFTALYDACVLYPAPLRDLLMQLALTDLFRVKQAQTEGRSKAIRAFKNWVKDNM